MTWEHTREHRCCDWCDRVADYTYRDACGLHYVCGPHTRPLDEQRLTAIPSCRECVAA